MKNIFRRGAIYALAIFILGLPQITYAITFDYTGHLSGPAFLGTIGPSADLVSGYFSFGIGETPTGTSTLLNHPSGLTGFSLSVNGMTILMRDVSANVEIWNNKSTLGTDALEDRIEFLPSITGAIFTDIAAESWVPYQADFRLRYRGTSLSPPTALTSTALPQNISLTGRFSTYSDIRLAYYMEGWTGDASERPEISQYIKIDYIGQPDQIASTPAPVPEPGTLLLLGSGLAGMFFFRKKMA